MGTPQLWSFLLSIFCVPLYLQTTHARCVEKHIYANRYRRTERLPGDEGAVFNGGIDRIVSVCVVEEISRSRRAAGHSACRSERGCEPSCRDVRGRHG